ncbi:MULTISPECIES: NAD synthetase [unclassified Pseudomonas]|uniref:NAD synthetase n=1 Tax=unclassified Pseudomonas TaxID=196821 RepID=UPI0015A462C2|nr:MULTISPECIES: NAD synthetase [unclassified Pseudomonas]NVZ17026.1 NAD synthetase [Pseudomonas sp. IPO3775]NWA80675.1 NAD synthetase [Pseudomonas sp. C8002]
MAASLLKDGFPSAHLTTRQRIESSLDLHRLFFAIDSDPALIGAGVVYIDEQFNVVTLREFQPICSVVPKKVVLREAPRYVGPSEFKRMLAHEPRESKRMAEALNTAVTCTGAILSWVVISSGIALMPFTAGTSAVITFIGKAATAASSVQCLIGLGRTGAEAFAPQALDRLDSNTWFEAVTVALDGVAMLGVATSTLTTVKAIQVTTKVTGKPIQQVLKGLTRQERVKLNDELLKIRDPRLTSKLLKLKQASGAATKRISATQMQQATTNHIRDALAATLGFTSSAVSGNVKTLAIGIYEEVSQ